MATKKPVPNIPDDQGRQNDALAKKEEKAFASGCYEAESKKSEHARSEWVKWILHWAAVLIFLEFVAIYMILLGMWAYHLIFPPTWWLFTAEQFDKVQAIVLSGVVASSLSKYYERYMK